MSKKFINNKENKPIILDCTFRDGGYYTNWTFDQELVIKYLNLCNEGLCNIVELGLRTLQSGRYLGPHAYTCKDFFQICKNYKKIKYSVLVNWKDISLDPTSESKLFYQDSKEDIIDIVRIALRYDEILKTKSFIKNLKSKGYIVTINIQNCDNLLNKNIKKISDDLEIIDPDILYLADTNGCLEPKITTNLIDKLKRNIDIPIGVHMHNNKGLALANSLSAVTAGASFVDTTITGIGRGPGNAQTEYFTPYFYDLSTEILKNISSLINIYFYPLKNKKHWGDNFYYYLSGKFNQSASLMHEKLLHKDYDNNCLVQLATSNQKSPISSYELTTNKVAIFKYIDATAAIFANGSSWKIEKNNILSYLKNLNPITCHINFPLDEDYLTYINFFCTCDPLRLSSQIEKYQKFNSIPLVSDLSKLKELNIDTNKLNISDFKFKLIENNLIIKEDSCIIPYLQSLCYGIAFLYSRGHKNILLIGVEGFKEPVKNIQIINCLNLIKKNYPDLNLTNLNNNVLGIKSKSIFEISTKY